MKKFYTLGITLIAVTFTLLFCLSLKTYADELSSDKDIRNHYAEAMEDTDYIIFKAKVIEIEYDDTSEKRNVSLEADIRYQHLKIEILDGSHKGETMTIRHTIDNMK